MSTTAAPSDAPVLERRPWQTDRSLLRALQVGFVLRIVPLALWAFDGCVRDECTYIKLARRFAEGEGMTGSAGWIWAPGYPALLGILEALLGWAQGLKLVQVPVSLLACVLVYQLARLAFPEKRSVARVAAWLYALSPHLIFFSIRLWSEVIYGTILLGGLLLLLLSRHDLDEGRKREGWKKTVLTGVLGGICVLFVGCHVHLPVGCSAVVGRWGKRTPGLRPASLPGGHDGHALLAVRLAQVRRAHRVRPHDGPDDVAGQQRLQAHHLRLRKRSAGPAGVQAHQDQRAQSVGVRLEAERLHARQVPDSARI